MKTHLSLTSSPSKGVKSETQAPWCPKLYPFCFRHLLKLFIHSLHHLKSIPLFVFMWLVVLPVFLPPASATQVLFQSLRLYQQKGWNTFSNFPSQEHFFFLMNLLLGKHVFQICAEMPNVLAALTGPCTVWPSLPLTPSGAHHSLLHFVPIILASVSRNLPSSFLPEHLCSLPEILFLDLFLLISSHAMSSVKLQLFRKDVSHQLLLSFRHCILLI